MEGIDKAAQIRISDELFGGTGGEQFVQLLDKGQAGIQGQIDRAREMGIVMDSDMIAKAAALDAKFQELATRSKMVWQGMVVDAAIFFGFIEREKEKLEFDPATTANVLGEQAAQVLAAIENLSQDSLGMIESVTVEFEDLASAAGQMVPQLNDAAVMLRGMGKEAEAQALTTLADRFGEATAEWRKGTITGEQYADKLRDIGTEAQTSIDKMGELDRVQLAGVIGQVSALLGWIGMIPGAVQQAKAEISTMEGVNLQGGMAPDLGRFGNPYEDTSGQMESSPKPRAAPAMTQELGAAPSTGGGSGKAKGGGGSGKVTSLISDLMTPIEEITAWHEQAMEVLNGATEAQLEALGGKNEAIERLEAEHAERLAEIDGAKNAQRLDEMGAFFGSMAAIAQAGGDKLAKVARVTGAAEAFANTLVAQSQVLRDPTLGFWGKMAAYGAIGAAGFGVVASLKGGGGGGGSTGGSEGSSGAAAAVQPAAQQVHKLTIDTVGNGMITQEQLQQILRYIQKESKAGVVIDMTVKNTARGWGHE